MHETVATLYSTFSRYKLDHDFAGCDHCVSEAESRELATTPLTELTSLQLQRYAFKAITTWGTAEQFKHFLPRLFELMLDDLDSFDCVEVMIGKLKHAKWETWPKNEQEAVRRFLMHLWDSSLGQHGHFPNDDRCAQLLGGFAEAHPSIRTYLDRWLAMSNPRATLHAAQMIYDTADEIMETGTTSVLWGQPKRATAELVQWLGCDEVRYMLIRHDEIVPKYFPDIRPLMAGLASALASYQKLDNAT